MLKIHQKTLLSVDKEGFNDNGRGWIRTTEC